MAKPKVKMAPYIMANLLMAGQMDTASTHYPMAALDWVTS